MNIGSRLICFFFLQHVNRMRSRHRNVWIKQVFPSLREKGRLSSHNSPARPKSNFVGSEDKNLNKRKPVNTFLQITCSTWEQSCVLECFLHEAHSSVFQLVKCEHLLLWARNHGKAINRCYVSPQLLLSICVSEQDTGFPLLIQRLCKALWKRGCLTIFLLLRLERATWICIREHFKSKASVKHRKVKSFVITFWKCENSRTPQNQFWLITCIVKTYCVSSSILNLP